MMTAQPPQTSKSAADPPEAGVVTASSTGADLAAAGSDSTACSTVAAAWQEFSAAGPEFTNGLAEAFEELADSFGFAVEEWNQLAREDLAVRVAHRAAVEGCSCRHARRAPSRSAPRSPVLAQRRLMVGRRGTRA